MKYVSVIELMIRISLIIPCFNESENIQKGVLDQVGEFTKSDARFPEVLIVDDGSTDDSCEQIQKKYLSQFPKFRLIKNPHQGKAAAIIKGTLEATAEYVFFSDMDLATPIESCEKLIAEVQNGYAIAIGSRKGQRDGAPLSRKVMAIGMIIVRRVIIGITQIQDTQCGFKLFKRDAAMRIIDHLKVFHDRKTVDGSSVSAGFDLEFLFLAQRLGYTIKEISVPWKHVETKRVTFFKSSWEALRDIMYIKWYDFYHAYPQR